MLDVSFMSEISRSWEKGEGTKIINLSNKKAWLRGHIRVSLWYSVLQM